MLSWYPPPTLPPRKPKSWEIGMSLRFQVWVFSTPLHTFLAGHFCTFAPHIYLTSKFLHSAPHIYTTFQVLALRSTHFVPQNLSQFFFFFLYCCIAWQHPQTLDFDRAAWRFDRAAWRRLLRPASPAFLSFLSGLLLPPARPATPSTAARQLTADSWLRGF